MTKYLKLGFITAVILSLALAAPVAMGCSGKDAQQNSAPPAAGSTSVPIPATNDPDYVIGAPDVLNINVWKEPELTSTVPVRPDGKISLPLLNDVKAEGLTPMQLTTALTEQLKKYVSEPRVTVVVTAVNSKSFYIVGEVGRAGSYPLLANQTVLQALSSAGGFTQFANLKNIHILRNSNGKQVKYPFNYREVLKGKKQEQNFTLKPGDTIVVP